MRQVIFFITFILIANGWALADDQQSAKVAACISSLDLSTLPSYTPFIKTDLPDLENYFTCKAAMTENIQACDVFPDGSSQKTNCQDGYNNYYATFGKLFKNGQMSDEGLAQCLKIYPTKNACAQFAEIMLSGNTNNCEGIEGASSDAVAQCKEMGPTNAHGRSFFMELLRRRDPSQCDLMNIPTVSAICKGLLIKGADGCQLDAGVDHFKKSYCEYLSK